MIRWSGRCQQIYEGKKQYDISVKMEYIYSDMCFFFQAEDGIRDLVRSRGLGDVYKRQVLDGAARHPGGEPHRWLSGGFCRGPVPPARRPVALSLIHI